jgi:hypothetical protein
MTDLLLESATDTDDHYDVIADGQVVGYIMFSEGAPPGTPWIWTLAYGFDDELASAEGYEATKEAAMQAFARSWYRGA